MVGLKEQKPLARRIHEGEYVFGLVYGSGDKPVIALSDTFYLDGFSLVGSGTQADPIRATGNINWNDSFSDEFSNNSYIQIDWTQAGGVWLDGVTLNCEVYDETANDYFYPIHYYQNVYSTSPQNPNGPFMIERYISDPGDPPIMAGIAFAFSGDDYISLIEAPVQGSTDIVAIGLININNQYQNPNPST